MIRETGIIIDRKKAKQKLELSLNITAIIAVMIITTTRNEIVDEKNAKVVGHSTNQMKNS